jgi:AbiV family abortive infection protein
MEQFDVFDTLKHSFDAKNNLVRSCEEFDNVVVHIVQLLCDAYCLYLNNSFPSSVFLSITALEETAKGHFGSFSSGERKKGKPKNIFKDHKTKHLLSAMHTVPMGERLREAIGEEELYRIMHMAHNSELIKLREDALYFQRENDSMIIPSQKIDKKLSRILLLFSIEAFDDVLVGMTNYTVEASKKTDMIFTQLSTDINDNTT